MIRAIAFDFGGTLFTTGKMGTFTPEMINVFIKGVTRNLNCPHELANKVLIAYTDAWKSRRIRGGELPERELSSLDLFQSALSSNNTKLNKEQMIEILDAFHGKEAEMFLPLPRVVESIPAFCKYGYRLCVVSNNPWSESIRASFRREGVESFFERIIVSCDIGFRKPHRQIFEELQIQMKLPSSEILFVGDSYVHDIEMPKKMGMRTCLVDFEGVNKNDQSERSMDADLFLTCFNQLLPAVSAL